MASLLDFADRTDRGCISPARMAWEASRRDGTSTYDPVTGLPLNRPVSRCSIRLIRAHKPTGKLAVLISGYGLAAPCEALEPEQMRMARIEAARVKKRPAPDRHRGGDRPNGRLQCWSITSAGRMT